MPLTRRDFHYMEVVMTNAVSTEKVVARLSSMIVIKNRPISFGVNQRKTHPFQAKYGRNDDAIFLHSEIAAIKNALNQVPARELKNATLYIARAKKANSLPNSKDIQGMAKPCEGCLKCITYFGIRKVVYTTDTQGKYDIL